MNAECERNLERLSPLLDGELAQGDAVVTRAHLAGCPPCEFAFARLTRLEVISVQILRGAPAVAPGEWSNRWSRIDRASARMRKVLAGGRREAVLRRSMSLFALAAAALVAATLILPLVSGRFERPFARGDGHGQGHAASAPLKFSNAPGANAAQVLEYGGDDRYQIDVDLPSSDADAIVIMISKL